MLTWLLAGALFGISVGAAIAGTASSPKGYYGPIKGWSYWNQATVHTGSPRIYASTTVSQNGTSNVPSGYMGALARLYKNSALCASNGYSFNSGPANSLSVPTLSACGSGTYYSYGATAAYNGNGYSYYYTFKSPSQNG